MADNIENKVRELVRPEIRALKAYHVPDATGLVKLDAMENPYSWPEDVRREWMEVLQGVALNRYPDPDARRLRERLRSTCRPAWNLFSATGRTNSSRRSSWRCRIRMPLYSRPHRLLSCMK